MPLARHCLLLRGRAGSHLMIRQRPHALRQPAQNLCFANKLLEPYPPLLDEVLTCSCNLAKNCSAWLSMPQNSRDVLLWAVKRAAVNGRV